MQKEVPTLADLETEARRFVSALSKNDEGATVVTLAGELGAGKTAFTKAVAKALGVEDVVNSPTFVLEKIYGLPLGGAFKHLVHIDAYRLEDGDNLSALGFDELVRDNENLIFVEWPERVRQVIPPESTEITFHVLPNGSHTLSYG